MADALRTQVLDGLRFAAEQARRVLEAHPATSPEYTEGGKWHSVEASHPPARDRGLPRLVRLLARSGVVEDAAFWRVAAEALPWGEREVRRAGSCVAAKFRHQGQYLRAPATMDSVVIDSMLDVRSIYDAAGSLPAGESGGESLNAHELTRRATQHCLTVRRVLCRGDGSVAQEAVFDPKTGEVLRHATRQGYRADSCWSRGQAGSMYGFGTCYEATRDRRFLKTAEDQAEFWMMNTPEAGVPPWDFDAPLDGRLTRMQGDSSAAAIAAVGLFNLGRLTHDRIKARGYENAAMRTVETLTRLPYLATGDTGWEGVLKGGVYDNRAGAGVDESVMVGDAFGVEAMVGALELL